MKAAPSNGSSVDAQVWVAAGLFGASWLLPIRELPWPWFHADLMVASALALLAFRLATDARGPLPVPRTVPALLALAAVPLLQRACGLIHFTGDAILASLYLAGFALAMACGHAVARQRPSEARPWALALVVSGVLCSAMALRQSLGPPSTLSWLLDPANPLRVTANLAQPNLLATLLLLSLVAALGLHQTRALGTPALTAIAALLCMGVTLTQSRSGWLGFGVLILGLALLHRRAALRLPLWACALLAAFFLTAVLTRPVWSGSSPAARAAEALAPQPTVRLSTGTGKRDPRPLHWAAMAQALAERPWAGYGWNQVAVAQALAQPQESSHEFIEHSHNLIIDLLVWNGLPLGLLVLAAAAWWLWRRLRGCRRPTDALLLLGLGVLLTHAMTEYPLDYFGFLATLGFIVGALDATVPDARLLALPRAPARVGMGLLAVVVVGVAYEYPALEKEHAAMRLRWSQRAPAPTEPAPAEARLLTQLQALLQFMRIDLNQPIPPQKWAAMNRVAERYGYDAVLLRLAMAAARQQRPEEAALAMSRLCRTQPDKVCAARCREFTAATAAAGGKVCEASSRAADSVIGR